jgi:hypothetical protein
MVVPSGLADSLNVPSILGAMGGAGLVPRDGEGRVSLAGGEAAGPVKETTQEVAATARKEL